MTQDNNMPERIYVDPDSKEPYTGWDKTIRGNEIEYALVKQPVSNHAARQALDAISDIIDGINNRTAREMGFGNVGEIQKSIRTLRSCLGAASRERPDHTDLLTERCPDCDSEMILSCSGLDKFSGHDGKCVVGTEREPSGTTEETRMYKLLTEARDALQDTIDKMQYFAPRGKTIPNYDDVVTRLTQAIERNAHKIGTSTTGTSAVSETNEGGK